MRSRPKVRSARLQRARAGAVDFGMCVAMNLLQTRHRLNGTSLAEMERYVIECEKLSAPEYYAAPDDVDLSRAIRTQNPSTITWRFRVITAR